MPERSKWTMVGWAVVAALLVLAVARAVGSRGAEPPPLRIHPGAAEGAGSGVDAGAGSEARAATGAGGRGALYVHVAGAVRRPGLYRVGRGSRVAAAIERAGGPKRSAELAAVNLAAPLEDGQQVVVPRRGQLGAAAGAAAGTAGGPAGAAGGAARGSAAVGAAGAGAGGKLSLATATLEQLDALDGIGPTLAQRILAFRDSHGGFRSIDQLREVEGIGEKRFESLRAALRP